MVERFDVFTIQDTLWQCATLATQLVFNACLLLVSSRSDAMMREHRVLALIPFSRSFGCGRGGKWTECGERSGGALFSRMPHVTPPPNLDGLCGRTVR